MACSNAWKIEGLQAKVLTMYDKGQGKTPVEIAEALQPEAAGLSSNQVIAKLSSSGVYKKAAIQKQKRDGAQALTKNQLLATFYAAAGFSEDDGISAYQFNSVTKRALLILTEKLEAYNDYLISSAEPEEGTEE